MDPWVRRDGFARPRSPMACVLELRTSVTSRESLARKRRYAEDAAHGGRGCARVIAARMAPARTRSMPGGGGDGWAIPNREQSIVPMVRDTIAGTSSSTATACRSPTTTSCSSASAAPARAARGDPPARSASITATRPARCAGCSAANAISASVTSKITRSCCGRRALISRPRLALPLAAVLAALLAALLATSAAARPDQNRAESPSRPSRQCSGANRRSAAGYGSDVSPRRRGCA